MIGGNKRDNYIPFDIGAPPRSDLQMRQSRERSGGRLCAAVRKPDGV